MHRRILVSLDGSEHAFKALDYACDLAAKYGAELLILHVVVSRELPDAVRQFLSSEHVEAPPEWVYEQLAGRGIVRAGEERARERGLASVRSLLENGDPAAVIADVARREEADLIVVGTRGVGELKGLVMGSVARKVCHGAACTVIMVH